MADKNNFYFTSKYCWTDGSGFEFDGEPANLVGFTPNSESFFSLSGKMAKNTRNLPPNNKCRQEAWYGYGLV